ncbi:MAG: nucleoside deaminase [Candidatus Kaelpia aquatica]|nr:nucleoside deaminase [Candidatus Kaelpia aquatica]
MAKNKDIEFMNLALAAATKGVESGQTPFGACIVKNDKVISCCHNRVWASTDITAHAEIVAIREACENLDSIDLSGCVIYSTTEPCPMCFTAIHWAKIDKIIYGASIEDAKSFGFAELIISNREMKYIGKSKIEIVSGCLKDDNLRLFSIWKNRDNSRAY